jgi:hypothetical protein
LCSLMHNNIIIIQRPAVLGRKGGGEEGKIMKEGTVEKEGKKSEVRESK